MNLNNIEGKTIVKTITLLMLSFGFFSLVQFAIILYDLFFSISGPHFFEIFSIFAVSRKMLAAVGLFYLAAALFAFRSMLKRSFLLFTYIAWSQLILFAVGFMAFGIFCGPYKALPQLIFAVTVISLSTVLKVRSAFDSDSAHYRRHYRVMAGVFVMVVLTYALYASYFYVKYPYVFSGPAAVEDYRATPLFSETAGPAGTTEIYGFKIGVPSGFSLSGVSHQDAFEDNGAFDRVLFSSGSDQIMLTSKNGILIEQLYRMTAVFDVKNSYDFFTEYINDRYGVVWMTVKSLARFEYCRFIADGWFGYVEKGPLLSDGRQLAKNFNIWSDDPACGARLEITFFFKSGGPEPALVSSVLSSLKVSKAVPVFSNIMKNAVNELNSGDFEKAMILLADALALQPKSADAHYYLAKCFISRSAPDKKNFKKHIEEALRMDPAHKEALDLKSRIKI